VGQVQEQLSRIQARWNGADHPSTEVPDGALPFGVHDLELRLEIRFESRFHKVNEQGIYFENLVRNTGSDCVGDLLAAGNDGCSRFHVTAVRPQVPFSKSVFPFSAQRAGFFREFVREVCRPGSPRCECGPGCVPHQLLSERFRKGTPNVSCLLDCGDRGRRPF